MLLRCFLIWPCAEVRLRKNFGKHRLDFIQNVSKIVLYIFICVYKMSGDFFADHEWELSSFYSYFCDAVLPFSTAWNCTICCVAATERISENMHIVANEPSLAFYRLQVSAAICEVCLAWEVVGMFERCCLLSGTCEEGTAPHGGKASRGDQIAPRTPRPLLWCGVCCWVIMTRSSIHMKMKSN